MKTAALINDMSKTTWSLGLLGWTTNWASDPTPNNERKSFNPREELESYGGRYIGIKARRGRGTRVFNKNKMVSPFDKPKKYPPCNHRSLDKPPPNKARFEAINFQVVEELVPINCRCVEERGITEAKVYHIIPKGEKFIPGKPRVILDAAGTMLNGPPFTIPMKNFRFDKDGRERERFDEVRD